MLNKLATPVLVPFQYGDGLLPGLDFESNVRWNAASTITRDPGTDFGKSHSLGRSPIEMASMKSSGRYACCNGKYKYWKDCVGAFEMDRISKYLGSWQPLVCYRDESGCGDGCVDTCGCPSKISSGRWLWTMAKLTELTPNYSLDTYLKKSEAQTFSFTLSEPFREVSHHWFRFGSAPPQSGFMLPSQVEAIYELDRKTFFPPNGVPSCCQGSRWWYKDWKDYYCEDWDLLTPLEKYSKYAWPGQTYTAYGDVMINIPGTAEPSCYIKAEFSGDTRIYNETYGELRDYVQVGNIFDVDNNLVFKDNNVVTSAVALRLVAGYNRIRTTSRLTLGVIPRWL